MEAPKLPRIFFRNMRHEPKRFSYAPRHFDPKKEKWEERKEKLAKEAAYEAKLSEEQKEHRAQWRRGLYREGVLRSNVRLIAVLAGLLFAVWAIVKRLEILSN
jgi:hypothetical protein